MKKFFSILVFLICSIVSCNAELIISGIEYAWRGGNIFTQGVNNPHLRLWVGGDNVGGEPIYVLIVEYDRAQESDETFSIPNASLLIKTSDNEIIKKTSAYNETKDYVTTVKEQSVTEVVNGKLVTNTIPAHDLHHYTAYYQFLMTKSDFEKISKGIIKIRLQSDPIFEKTYKKDKIGKRIWNQFRSIYSKVKKPRSFDDGF